MNDEFFIENGGAGEAGGLLNTHAPAIGDSSDKVSSMPKVVQGLDGAGWVDHIERNPFASLPSGAGYLVVAHLRR